MPITCQFSLAQFDLMFTSPTGRQMYVAEQKALGLRPTEWPDAFTLTRGQDQADVEMTLSTKHKHDPQTYESPDKKLAITILKR